MPQRLDISLSLLGKQLLTRAENILHPIHARARARRDQGVVNSIPRAPAPTLLAIRHRYMPAYSAAAAYQIAATIYGRTKISRFIFLSKKSHIVAPKVWPKFSICPSLISTSVLRLPHDDFKSAYVTPIFKVWAIKRT
jgi:hypothetical protein